MSDPKNKIEYERTDADLTAVTRVGIGIAVVALVTALALVPILSGMVARQKRNDAPSPPIAGFEPGRKAPEPRLQEEPFGDWTTLKARQESMLEGYGWVDEAGGVARIPIDQAMRMLVERGVPSRPGPSPSPAAAPSEGVASPAAPPAPSAPGHVQQRHP